MDQELRITAGLKPLTNEHTSMMLWASHNIAQAGHPPRNLRVYGNWYVTGYQQLWGLAS